MQRKPKVNERHWKPLFVRHFGVMDASLYDAGTIYVILPSDTTVIQSNHPTRTISLANFRALRFPAAKRNMDETNVMTDKKSRTTDTVVASGVSVGSGSGSGGVGGGASSSINGTQGELQFVDLHDVKHVNCARGCALWYQRETHNVANPNTNYIHDSSSIRKNVLLMNKNFNDNHSNNGKNHCIDVGSVIVKQIYLDNLCDNNSNVPLVGDYYQPIYVVVTITQIDVGKGCDNWYFGLVHAFRPYGCKMHMLLSEEEKQLGCWGDYNPDLTARNSNGLGSILCLPIGGAKNKSKLEDSLHVEWMNKDFKEAIIFLILRNVFI